MFQGTAKPLSEAGLAKAMQTTGVSLPALWAVMTVETKGCGFLADRRPQILFERHIFHRRTKGKFWVQAPDISSESAGGYGATGAWQYERLERAIKLNRMAALESCSWGLGQVMGFNAAKAGYADAASMATAMCASEDAQFQAMMNFIISTELTDYLKRREWAAFAYKYNGEDFQKNKYDEKLAMAYARFSTGPMPDLRIRAAQLYLTYLGYAPRGVDGWFGGGTQKALVRFQIARDLAPSGALDDTTYTALEKAALSQAPG
jgi:hypothetical protein